MEQDSELIESKYVRIFSSKLIDGGVFVCFLWLGFGERDYLGVLLRIFNQKVVL